MLFLALDQLDADPQKKKAADQLQIRNLQQHVDDQHENDAEHDSTGAAGEDGWLLMALFEVPAGQRDDQRVVPGQDDIYQNDLGEAAPEGGRKLKSHDSAISVPIIPAP